MIRARGSSETRPLHMLIVKTQHHTSPISVHPFVGIGRFPARKIFPSLQDFLVESVGSEDVFSSPFSAGARQPRSVDGVVISIKEFK